MTRKFKLKLRKWGFGMRWLDGRVQEYCWLWREKLCWSISILPRRTML